MKTITIKGRRYRALTDEILEKGDVFRDGKSYQPTTRAGYRANHNGLIYYRYY